MMFFYKPFPLCQRRSSLRFSQDLLDHTKKLIRHKRLADKPVTAELFSQSHFSNPCPCRNRYDRWAIRPKLLFQQ